MQSRDDGFKFFADLLDEPLNGLVEQAMSDGRVPIGYTCSQVPAPLLSLGKLFPVRLRAQGLDGTELADIYLSNVLCSYSRSILERALENGFDFLGGVVATASCDHIRRASQNIDALEVNKDNPDFFTYLIDLPRKVSPALIDWLAKDFRNLALTLNKRYGVDTSDECVREAIAAHNACAAVLSEIGELRKQNPSPVTGSEFHTLMVAFQTAPKDMLIKPLEDFLAAARKRTPKTDSRARIMILGSTCDNPPYTDVIEGQGAVVVADRYCWGSLPGLEPIPVDGDPYENMARYYLEGCSCPRMMERYSDRINQVVGYARDYDVDGVIFENMKFCDSWGYEVLTMVDGLRNAGIPVVRIEREYPLTGEGQLRTRVQAFIESIEGKRDAAALQA